MQDNFTQAQVQPFVKLAQANMDLFNKFSTSPEVTKQASANATALIKQATESSTSLMRSDAFTQMIQGMFNNYTEFLLDIGRSSMAFMNQGQQALMQQVQQAQEVTEDVIDVADVRARRPRQAA